MSTSYHHLLSACLRIEHPDAYAVTCASSPSQHI